MCEIQNQDTETFYFNIRTVFLAIGICLSYIKYYWYAQSGLEYLSGGAILNFFPTDNGSFYDM